MKKRILILLILIIIFGGVIYSYDHFMYQNPSFSLSDFFSQPKVSEKTLPPTYKTRQVTKVVNVQNEYYALVYNPRVAATIGFVPVYGKEGILRWDKHSEQWEPFLSFTCNCDSPVCNCIDGSQKPQDFFYKVDNDPDKTGFYLTLLENNKLEKIFFSSDIDNISWKLVACYAKDEGNTKGNLSLDSPECSNIQVEYHSSD